MPIASGIYYAETGANAPGAPLVLVHGSGGSHLDWPGSLRRITGRRALTIDLPGHGRSTLPGREAVVDYAADVIRLLDALSNPVAVVAGHSLGGAIALQLAVSHPDRIAGLILVGTGARLRVHPAILDHILPEPVETGTLIVDWEYAPGASQSMRDKSRTQLLKTDPRVIWGDYSACNHFDIMADLDRITAPALIIVGSEDRMTPVKYSEYLAKTLSDAKLVVIEKAGHMVALEQSEAVASAVQAWIATL
jgi:pimeloyl-ACP methyl ester carboxylesterase